jgi:hypothetical protein
VDIVPSAVTSELADAALGSPALSQALELASWIGDGQQLTASGTLRPAAAAQACRALGIEQPAGQPRGADDLAALAPVWEVARDAGFIMVADGHVRELGTDRVRTDAAAALRSWLRALAPKLDLPEEPCGRCLTVLAGLAEAADGVVSTADLMNAVRSAYPAPDNPDDLARELRHAVSAIASLLSFAAVVPAVEEPADDDRLRLMPLGRMLADSVFAQLAVEPAADAGALVAALGELPPKAGLIIARPWLAARTPAAAARDLLGYAASAAVQQRTVAVSCAKEIGPDAAAAWRDYARTPGFGAYAREWLAGLGEEVAADPRDEAWLTIEAISVASVSLPPEAVSRLISSAARGSDLSDLPTIMTILRDSGHPDAERVAEAISLAAAPARSATVVRIQHRAKKKRAKRKR